MDFLELKNKIKIFNIDSFRMPLFNDVTEQELENILQWLKSRNINNNIINDIDRIITEIIDVNKELLSKCDFDDISEFYMTFREFRLINPNAKITLFSYAAEKPYITYETEMYLHMLHRKMVQYSSLPENRNGNWKNYDFLHKFFLQLWYENHRLSTRIKKDYEEIFNDIKTGN